MSPAQVLTGNPIYNGASPQATTGTVDPMGYVDRQLNADSQQRSGLASAIMRRLGNFQQPGQGTQPPNLQPIAPQSAQQVNPVRSPTGQIFHHPTFTPPPGTTPPLPHYLNPQQPGMPVPVQPQPTPMGMPTVEGSTSTEYLHHGLQPPGLQPLPGEQTGNPAFTLPHHGLRPVWSPPNPTPPVGNPATPTSPIETPHHYVPKPVQVLVTWPNGTSAMMDYTPKNYADYRKLEMNHFRMPVTADMSSLLQDPAAQQQLDALQAAELSERNSLSQTLAQQLSGVTSNEALVNQQEPFQLAANRSGYAGRGMLLSSGFANSEQNVLDSISRRLAAYEQQGTGYQNANSEKLNQYLAAENQKKTGLYGQQANYDVQQLQDANIKAAIMRQLGLSDIPKAAPKAVPKPPAKGKGKG